MRQSKLLLNNQPNNDALLDAKALYNRAIWLLTRQEYCAKQLSQKLLRIAMNHDLVLPLITQLQQQGYLSDQRFAEAYLRSRIQRGETINMAALKAKHKGVEREALHEAVAAMKSDGMEIDEESACRRLLNKRDPQQLRFDDRRIWQRHLRYLCNKGYPMNIALETMQQHHSE